ncbi:MAG: hypothetical protein HY753_01890, partial [Nitrospirae bacterium]|nr:hypothetical protein [Nitrospirota bacterium]
MNRHVMLLLVGLLIFSATSRAQSDDLFWTGSVFNENIGMVENIRGFDWSSSGSGLAVGIGPLSAARPVGTEFSFLYQSYLFALTGPDGNTVQF